eukprot:2109450-Rhodomonas_salina.2
MSIGGQLEAHGGRPSLRVPAMPHLRSHSDTPALASAPHRGSEAHARVRAQARARAGRRPGWFPCERRTAATAATDSAVWEHQDGEGQWEVGWDCWPVGLKRCDRGVIAPAKIIITALIILVIKSKRSPRASMPRA